MTDVKLGTTYCAFTELNANNRNTIVNNFFIFLFRRVISHSARRFLVFEINLNFFRPNDKCTQKKRGPLCLHRYFEVLDNLHHQITTYKPTPVGGSAVARPGGDLRSVQVPKYQISYFAFSYSMMCITTLCGLFHKHSVSLIPLLKSAAKIQKN